MTQGQQAYSHLLVFARLFLGYHHLNVLDGVRMRRKGLFTTAAEKSAAAEKEKALAANR